MNPNLLQALPSWGNFYVILGSAAGALTGLQFIVMTLIANGRAPGSMREVHAFGTPTIVQFGTTLLLSCLMTVPWHSTLSMGATLTALGLLGIAYVCRIFFHARKTDYVPDTEDWFWYVVCPFLTFLLVALSGVLAIRGVPFVLYCISAAAIAFVFIALHNAWDTVTYLAVQSVLHPNKPAR